MPTNNTTYALNGELDPTLLGTIDWNQEWMHLQDIRRKADSAEHWNKRSKNYDRPESPSPYVAEFIQHANIAPGSSVLDMGCGTGSIAVTLALQDCSVTAADFSSDMIAEAKRRAEVAHAENMRTVVMAWEDNWAEHELDENSVDVVVASRSLAVYDLKAALTKMSLTARKFCAVTMSCGTSPRTDARLLAACGLQNVRGRDYQYAWNILVNEGYTPTCSFIYSERKDTYTSKDHALADFNRMIDDVAHFYPMDQVNQARRLIAAWLEDNIVANEEVGQIDEKGYPQEALRLREPRVIPWAFLSWDV